MTINVDKFDRLKTLFSVLMQQTESEYFYMNALNIHSS